MSRKLQNILILAGLLFLLVLLNLPLTSQTNPGITPEPRATKAPIDPFIHDIRFFQTELARTDLPEDARALAEAKLESVSMAATQRVEGMTDRPSKETIEAMPTIFVSEGMTFPDGIELNPLDIPLPVLQADVTVLTSWKKTTEERPYRIFSGYLENDPEQGIIMVPQLQSPLFHQYYTPERSGGVSVIAENGLVITLQSTTGALYYFDVGLEWFVDLEGTPLPTYTPSPTPIPTITPTPTPMPPYP
ncbi:MAG: hypothetical protein Fur0022_44140 [Anaerolineales bacterium]